MHTCGSHWRFPKDVGAYFFGKWLDQLTFLSKKTKGISLTAHHMRVVCFSVFGIGLSNQTDSIYASMSIISCRLCRYLVQVSCRLSSTPRRDFSAWIFIHSDDGCQHSTQFGRGGFGEHYFRASKRGRAGIQNCSSRDHAGGAILEEKPSLKTYSTYKILCWWDHIHSASTWTSYRSGWRWDGRRRSLGEEEWCRMK